MTTTKIGKRAVIAKSRSLQFHVPKVWLGEHGLSAGDLVYASYSVASRQIRYHATNGVGRFTLTLGAKSGTSTVLMVVPRELARVAGIEKGSTIELSVSKYGTLIAEVAL